MRVASKVGNLPFKFGHAVLLGSRIIRYVRDGRTDRQTDGRTKATLIASFLTVGGHNKANQSSPVTPLQSAATTVWRI